MTTVSLDEPERYPPTREVWLDERLAWAASDASLERRLRGSSDDGVIAAATEHR